MAVSLNLAGSVSTERNCHRDGHFNPPSVNGWYAAVWFTLGDIEPDSGPFQFVPDSHRGPILRRDRVPLFVQRTDRESPQWPRFTEWLVNDILDDEIDRRQTPINFVIDDEPLDG